MKHLPHRFRRQARWLLIVVIFLASAHLASAQNESGSRSLSRSQWQKMGYWCDSTTAMFQTRYPIITSIQPVSTSMPYDVLLSFVYLDSLLRFGDGKEAFARMRLWSSMNDTLKEMAKTLFRIDDYDLRILTQFVDEVGLNRKVTGNPRTIINGDTIPANSIARGRYVMSLADLRREFLSAYYRTIPVASERKALVSIVGADYVLRINVLSIDSMVNKNSPLGYKRYRVTEQVMDTLKGKVFTSPVTPLGTKDAGMAQLATNPTIQFQYTPMKYLLYTEFPNYPPRYPLRDSAFSAADGSFTMAVNQRAIVFLGHQNDKVDNQFDYYDLDVQPLYSNNALPITGGNVRDVNNIWTTTTSTPYATWKSRFQTLKSKVQSGAYRSGPAMGTSHDHQRGGAHEHRQGSDSGRITPGNSAPSKTARRNS